MSFVPLLVVSVAVVSLAIRVAGLILGWRWRRRARSQLAETNRESELPPVSVIKPIGNLSAVPRGALESFFQLDYPEYELLLCVQRPGDEAALQELCRAQRLPNNVRVRCFVGGTEVGVNPKINNMAAAFAAAAHDLRWIADAHLLAHPQDLRRLVAAGGRRSPRSVGLVHQLPLGGRSGTLADRVEQVFFGTQHARFYLVFAALGLNCVNGMSTLVRKSAIDAVGGLAAFAPYIAEDFFLGKALWDAGYYPVLAAGPALQLRPPSQSLRDVYGRQVRWTRLRKYMLPAATAAEVCLECGPVALALFLMSADPRPAAMYLGASFVCDLAMLSVVQTASSDTMPLGNFMVAWLLREVGSLVRFVHGVCGTTVSWDGHTYQLQAGGLSRRASADEVL